MNVVADGLKVQSSVGKNKCDVAKIVREILAAGGTLKVKSWNKFQRYMACLTREGADYAPLAGKKCTILQVRYPHAGQMLTVEYDKKS